MKKGWIIFLVLLAVCILGVGAWHFLFGPQAATQYSDDAGSLYRYGYLDNKDGFQFVIDGSIPAQQSWKASTDSATVAVVTEKKREKNVSYFSVHGLQTGTARITFTLQEGADSMANDFYRLWADISVQSNGNVTVLSSGHEELAPAASGGSGEYLYLLDEQEDAGTVSLRINGNAENVWAEQIDGNLVQMTQNRESFDVLSYTFAPVKDGETTVTVYSRLKSHTVTLQLRTENGAVHIASHSSSEEAFTPRAVLINGQAEFEQTYGVCLLPEDAQLYQIGQKKMWFLEDSTGWMQFALNGQFWELCLSDTEKMETLAAPMIESGEKLESVTVEGKKVKVYQYMQRTFAIWENAEGRGYLLMGEYVELDDFAKALKAVEKVTVHG